MGKTHSCSSASWMGATDLDIAEAFAQFRRGNLDAAEALLADQPSQPSALHLMGILRVRQGRVAEAASFLARSVALQPREAQAQFNYAKVLIVLGRHAEAETALRTALAQEGDHAEASVALATLLHGLGRFEEAQAAWRAALALRPHDGTIKLGLGDALAREGRNDDAVAVLEGALAEATNPALCADLHQALSMTLRAKPENALNHLEAAQRIDPARTGLDGDRAALLEAQHRFCDARLVYEAALARQPDDARLHEAYNDLLYRLGQDDAFLSSYDKAPASQTLLLQKGRFLLAAQKGPEAERLYGGMLAGYPDNLEASLGLGLALLHQGAVGAAVTALERTAERHPRSADAWCNLSGALIQSGDLEKAEAMALRSTMLEPHNQVAIATLGTCWRLMDDSRDAWLNGYEELVQIFDLEPPAGFADMAVFNAALNAELDRAHPPMREYVRQSLRGGTQTGANLFDSGQSLVESLRPRLAEAVDAYVAKLERGHDHPLACRKSEGWAMAGSWSSRLRDGGFHTNHVHPGGWISSCYYVDLPPAVNDQDGRQGWITFGEPSFKAGLAPRRSIQPKTGRLILFPSYMWHGTMPFHDRHTRTTIAFDLLPS